MAIEFFCPAGHALTMPDDAAGVLVECPLCGARLRTPAASVTASARSPVLAGVLLDEAPFPLRGAGEHETVGLDARGMPVTSGEEKNALRTTRIGVTFHLAAVLVLVIGMGLCTVAAGFITLMNVTPVVEKELKRMEAAQRNGQAPQPPPPFRIRPRRPGMVPPPAPADADLEQEKVEAIEKSRQQSTLLFSVNSGVAALLGLIGSWFLLAVPKTSRAVGLIGFSLVMDLIHLASNYLNESAFGGADLLLGLVSVSSLSLGFVLFMMFLHRLSLFLGEPELARQATHHLRAWSRLISGSLLCGVGGLMLLNFQQPVLAAMMLVGGVILLAVLWLLWIWRYVRLLFEMRAAIARRLEP